MKQIDNPKSTFNVYHNNADIIKSIEKDLWHCIERIKLNNYNLKTNKGCVKMINKKYDLEKDYQALKELYCFANPFQKTLIKR